MKTNVPGFVYFMQMLSPDLPIKIGWTCRPETRKQTLLTASPYEIELLHVMPGDIALERRLHKRFRKDRIRGEWFRSSSGLVEFINEQKKDRKPAQVTHSVGDGTVQGAKSCGWCGGMLDGRDDQTDRARVYESQKVSPVVGVKENPRWIVDAVRKRIESRLFSDEERKRISTAIKVPHNFMSFAGINGMFISPSFAEMCNPLTTQQWHVINTGREFVPGEHH